MTSVPPRKPTPSSIRSYRQAVVEPFLEKRRRHIDARAEARLADAAGSAASSRRRRATAGSLALAIASLALGVPISVIAVAAGKYPAGFMGLLVAWTAIAVINIGCGLICTAQSRHPPGRR